MKRTTKQPQPSFKQRNLPDVINTSPVEQFTQIPNALLRDPALSLRAKGLLCILLSNSEGWSSYIPALRKLTSDGETTLRSALNELEAAGYLMRVRLRDPATKTFTGSVWAYSNTANQHDVGLIEQIAAAASLEPVFQHSTRPKAKSGKAKFGKAKFGESNTKNTKYKNTKEKEEEDAARTYERSSGRASTGTPTEPGLMPDQAFITPAMFEQWWRLYPRKVDKGKAKTKWGQICRRADRPTFAQLRDAVTAQAATDRWATPQYIPHPTTWLNQERWLDDPAEMNNGSTLTADPTEPTEPPAQYAARVLGSQLLADQFVADCVEPAMRWAGGTDPAIAFTVRLLKMYEHVAEAQTVFTPALREALPGPMDVLELYLVWLDDNAWITERTLRVFDVENGLFARYRTWAASRDPYNRDPLTGAPVHRYA